MGESVRPQRRGVRPTIGVLAALALMLAGCNGSTQEESDPFRRIDALHGTRPGALHEPDVARIARAFGIDAEVERTAEGWEAEDEVRTLYVNRTPSAWYALFWDSSMLLEPAGDRTMICAAVDAPAACRFSSSPLARSVGAEPPTERAAREVAQAILERAGIFDDRWQVRVHEPGPLPVPCAHDLATRFDCNEQIVRTRAVILETYLGHGSTALRWGLIVAPNGRILTATGRIGELR